MPERQYTIAEAASLLNMTPRTVRAKCKAGAIDAHRIEGGQWRVSGGWLAGYLGDPSIERPAHHLDLNLDSMIMRHDFEGIRSAFHRLANAAIPKQFRRGVA